MPVAHIQLADFPLNVQPCLEAGKACLTSAARCAPSVSRLPSLLTTPCEAPGSLFTKGYWSIVAMLATADSMYQLNSLDPG